LQIRASYLEGLAKDAGADLQSVPVYCGASLIRHRLQIGASEDLVIISKGSFLKQNQSIFLLT